MEHFIYGNSPHLAWLSRSLSMSLFTRSKGVRLSREAAGQQKVHLLRNGQRRRVDGLDWIADGSEKNLMCFSLICDA